MFKVSVGDAPAEMKLAVLAMKKADKFVRREVSQRMRETMTPAWKQEVSGHLTGRTMERAMILPGTRIAAGNPPQLIAASSKRTIGSGGGLTADKHWAGFEYGAGDGVRSVTSKNGKTYKRHVMRHLPARNSKGYVLGPASANILPRVASFWTQSVLKSFMDAADGKGG